jgi:hypothetical protein
MLRGLRYQACHGWRSDTLTIDSMVTSVKRPARFVGENKTTSHGQHGVDAYSSIMADFDLETKFDGVDEPLSKAPALQRVLPEIRRTRKEWLELRAASFKQHATLYRQDVNKGIRAMRKTVKAAEREKEKGKMKRRAVAVVLALSTAGIYAFLLDLAAAIAKPIF